MTKTSRPRKGAALALATGMAFAAAPGVADATSVPAHEGAVIHKAEHPDPSAAYRWVDVLLEASGRDAVRYEPRPTILSRTMAIVLTAMYDAWAAYDEKAVGTRLGGDLRRPAAERTRANKEQAIAHAAYRALLFVYPEDEKWIRSAMRRQGYDPDETSIDVETPEGVGNVAAAALIEHRRHDGANQLGDEIGGDGSPYADYTYYRPRNSPDHVVDPLHWMPIPASDGKGGETRPGFLTAQWYRVKPFALERSDQFRAPEPPAWGSRRFKDEVAEVIAVNGELTLEQKAIVEFMREGPRSTGQSGHWLQFAQDLSRRDGYGLDDDVKLFFAVSNVVMDAFIACWDSKRHYDTGRPYWWARWLYPGKTLRAWRGPGQGVGDVPAERWHPYSPAIFPTPPFPGYTSGHATASGAASKLLELISGTDRFEAVEIMQVGDLTGEGAFTPAQMQAVDGKPAEDAPDTKEIRIGMPTWTATAEMAAMSRLWGGYHIRADNDEGLAMGRRIAVYSWPKYQAYFDGSR